MGENEHRKIVPRLLVCIVPTNREKRIRMVFRNNHIPIFYQLYGHGTAPSEVLNILGIGESSRLITVTIVPRYLVRYIIDRINGSLYLRDKGSGISFTVPITGMQSQVLKTMEYALDHINEEEKEVIDETLKSQEEEETKGKDRKEYAALWIAVSKGYADDVVRTAREAGATGGTVIRGNRRCEENDGTEHLGLPQLAEQEFVLMLVPREKKAEIMRAITATCGIASDARGTIICVPVDEVMGITV